jgi:PTH1 family peptidyl-tRNA hydrolase
MNPASVVDRDPEKYPPPDDKTGGQHIEVPELSSRKERRRNKKKDCCHPEPDKRKISPSTAEREEDEVIPSLTRKERKRLRKQQRDWGPESDTPPDSTPASKPFNAPQTERKSKATASVERQALAVSLSSCLSSSPTMPPTNYFPLLVASIGNPGAQYANTLHSAGHTILNIIRERGMYHPFRKGMEGLVSTPDTTRFTLGITGFRKDGTRGLAPGEDDFTLWQSTKLMNVSGPSVGKAWRAFAIQQQNQKGLKGRLVVVHDELEAPLGSVKIKEGTASPRGHNGLKSVQASMGGTNWWRVGVGIGRPESRDPAVVSKYVLRKMTYTEQKAMEDAAFEVLVALRKISEGTV